MSVAEPRPTCSYRQEDIQQILQIAIERSSRDASARQASEGEFSRQQLLEIAVELDISAECLEAAERDWLAQQSQFQRRQAFDRYRHGKLKRLLSKYLIVNAFLVPLNFVSSGHLSWSLYILLGWGLGITLTAWNTYQVEEEEYEKALRQWHRKRQLRQSINRFWNRWLKT